jgi:single-stranded DNA-binding protein
MTLAKAVVTGTVYRAPEKRFTQNNVPVSSFVVNIGDREEMLLRVIAKRTALDEVVSSLNKDDRVLVEGRLQITTVKNESGAERRIYEIDANTVEPMGAGVNAGAGVNTSSSNSSSATSNEDIVKFSQENFSDELIGEDEIPF